MTTTQEIKDLVAKFSQQSTMGLTNPVFANNTLADILNGIVDLAAEAAAKAVSTIEITTLKPSEGLTAAEAAAHLGVDESVITSGEIFNALVLKYLGAEFTRLNKLIDSGAGDAGMSFAIWGVTSGGLSVDGISFYYNWGQQTYSIRLINYPH